MNNNLYSKNHKGFSLVELIVVIAILAIITGIIVPVFLNYTEKARLAIDKTLVSEIIRSISIVTADTDCCDELLTDLDSDGNTYYDADIAIALSDHPNYKNKGYTIWHLYDENNQSISAKNSKIIAKLDEIIDGERIHFKVKAHKNKAYMIKIYKNEEGNIMVSPYTDEDYIYCKRFP